MAKKKPAAAEAVIPVIAETVFRSFVRGYQAARRAVDEAAESAKEILAKAVEKKHLHKKAFKLWEGLDNMRPDRRSELLHHFDHYRACSDWDDQLDLFRKKAAEAPTTSEEDPSDLEFNGQGEGATAH